MGTDNETPPPDGGQAGPPERSENPTREIAALNHVSVEEQKVRAQDLKDRAARALEVEQERTKFAYRMGLCGLVILAGLIGLSFYALHSWFAEPSKDFGANNDARKWAYIFAFVKAGTHAGITLAAVWFCYQVVRAAERMALPFHWLSSHPDLARALLGVQDPFRAVFRMMKELQASTGMEIEKIGDLVGKFVGKTEEKKK
jgi:hypothetical protein